MKKVIESIKKLLFEQSKNRIVLLPKLYEEDIESIEILSIMLDMEDKLLKPSTIQEFIKEYNRAIRMQNLPCVFGNDHDQMMQIQLRIILKNGCRLLFWPSDIDNDEMIVSYLTTKVGPQGTVLFGRFLYNIELFNFLVLQFLAYYNHSTVYQCLSIWSKRTVPFGFCKFFILEDIKLYGKENQVCFIHSHIYKHIYL